MTTLAVVQAKLRAATDLRAQAATARFVPTSQRVYGVRMLVLNGLIKEFRSGGFPLIEALWRSGAFEERLLAAKLLGVSARQDPERSLRFLRAASRDVTDWAVCDTLGTQGIRALRSSHRDALFAVAKRLTRGKRVWERRLGIVLLTNFAGIAGERSSIRAIVDPLRADQEPYVRKALQWLDRDLTASPSPPSAPRRVRRVVRS